MSYNKKDQGQRIAICRKNSGDTQKDAAIKLGIKRGTFATYESGVNSMPMDLMHKFAKSYQVNMEYLVSGEGEIVSNGVDYSSESLLALIDRIKDPEIAKEIKSRVLSLMEENSTQKDKMIALLEKYEKIVELVGSRLGAKIP